MAASSTPEKPTSNPNSKRDRRLFLVGLIVVCLLFFSSYSARLARRSAVMGEMHEWEEKIAESEQEGVVLADKLAYYSSPEYVDKVAREQLGLAKPGDQVIVVIQTTPMPTPVPVATVAPEAEIGVGDSAPTWMQWISLFAQERQLGERNSSERNPNETMGTP